MPDHPTWQDYRQYPYSRRQIFPKGKEIWQRFRKLSADDIAAYSNLYRLAEQREAFRIKNWPAWAHNYERSVFYQLNLENAAVRLYADAANAKTKICLLYTSLTAKTARMLAWKQPFI